MLLLFIFSCENDDNVLPITAEIEEPVIPVNFEENFGSTVTARFLGSVIDEQNNPVQGATIRIGNTVTTTDLFGTFSISDASAFEKFAYVIVEKDGYLKGSRALVPSITDVNRVEIMLLKKDVIATITSGETAMVDLTNGTEVSFSGNYTKEDGTSYSGQVDVVLKHLSPDDENMEAMMPGMLFAQDGSGDAVALETYGMLAVELRSSSGEELQLSEGSTSQISMPIPANSINPPATIPLWHFDEELGYWIEEGEATLQGNMYVGEVGHFSFWNYDYPYPAINLCITLVDEGGRPLAYSPLDIYSSLLNNTGTYGYTNSSGTECGAVPSGEEFTLTVPGSSCQNEPFSTTIGTFTSDTDITITVVSNQNATTLTGTFMNCNGQDVTDGYIQLFIDGESEIIPVTDGTINYTVSYCGTIDYSIKGVDVANNQVTEITIGTLNGSDTLDLGALSSCTGFVDADQDGVFDTYEDLNGDNDLTNDDTDQDGIPNYLDADDDGDGIDTANEDYDGDNDPTNDDSDGDQIPDYLDAEDVIVFTAEAIGTDCDPVLFDLDALTTQFGNDLHTYAYYLTQADATAQTSPLSSPLAVPLADLISNTQNIFVVATNNTSNQSATGLIYLYSLFEDTDGDGLTNCEELTGIDSSNTTLVPTGTSDPNDPNDPNPQPVATLSVSDITVGEDAGTVSVPVTLDVPSDVDTVISISTYDSSATSPMDYQSTVMSLTILAGDVSVVFSVSIIDDAEFEQNEEFGVLTTIDSGNLLNPSGQTILSDVSIIDNEIGSVLSIGSVTIQEDSGTVIVPVTLDIPNVADTVISISTFDASATAPMDYQTTVMSLTILAGQVTGNVTIPIIDDATNETDETFLVRGDVFSGNIVNPEVEGVVTIIDNDVASYPTSGDIAACSDISGVATFDLNNMNTYYSNGDASAIISYHLTDQDAQSDTGAVASPYQLSDNATLFVRIENTSGAVQVSTLICIVNISPAEAIGLSLTECDGNGDGFGTFDLSQLDAQIVQTQTGLVVTHYETAADLQNQVNALPPTYTNITATQQTIFYRVEDTQTGCFTVGDIDLIVDPGC